MLNSLRVRNLALAENVAVEFKPGLNVITGETGAGKSILMGALALLLGERADKTLIRTGEEVCSAEAVFELMHPAEVNEGLDALGLPPCEDGRLVIRRVMKANGANQTLINDAAVTLQALKQIGERLVDMHGPHDHQSLFHPAAQLDILDAFGHTEDERATYAQTYAKASELEARREALLQQAADPEGQIELLTYRIKEIEAAAPVEGEEEAVLQEHTTAGSAQRIMELTGGLVNALTENEGNAFNALASMQRPLEELERLLPAAVGWREEAADLATRVQALDAAIRHAVDHIEADPARMEWLDQRLSTYRKLQRKYGATVAEILAVLETSKCRLDELEQRDERLKELDAARNRLREELLARGRALGAKRRIAAASLAEAIVGELEFLGFPHSAFAVDLAEGEPKADGMDEVEFGFAPNVGENMRPLRAIASSGEISRVMLAIKAVLAQHDRIPVLVFDEIDANLGGEMGHAVGRELAGVADRHQVLCITHLPQVAVHGTTHFAVSKQVQDGRTFTRVRELDAHGRIEEVARMLGGGAEVRASVEHARELLFRARRK